jgi:putative DNA primase/helicase
MREKRQWVRWRREERDGKATKIPYEAAAVRAAKTNSAETWGTFADALKYMPRGDMSGVGYVFAYCGGEVGIDLDGCRDPETGAIAEWARPILERFAGTYAEVSPSQSGVKIFARGTLPHERTGKKITLPGDHCGIEAYQHGRFFAVTGERYGDHPSEVADCQEAITWLWHTYIAPPKKAKARASNSSATSGRTSVLDRARKYIAKMGPAISGQGGHDHTFKVALALCKGFDLDEGEALQLLEEWNATCQPPWDERDLLHKLESAQQASVEGGYLLGDSPEFTRRRKSKPRQAEQEQGSDDDDMPPDDEPEIFFEEERTEAANGIRLVRAHGRDMRYVATWDVWCVWDGSRWQQDATCAIDARAKQVAAELWGQYRQIKKNHCDNDLIDAVRSFCKASNSANGVSHMIDMARSEQGIAITHDALDRAEMLLNVINGTIDLSTGMVRLHDRADLLTKQAPVVYDPAAECPLWLRFLQDIFQHDAELIDYVRRLVGYCLTGSTRDHILPFLHGAGANGKSVFTKVVMELLGTDYSMRSAPELLMAKGNETHPTERADLFGKRLVISNEIEEGKRLNEALVKDLTGGDAIRARRMREDFWQFAPTHKVWIVGNHKPVIRGTDNGIWRRVKLIPFNRIFAEDEQDKELPVKLQRELSGILNWAICGCLEWQHEGLGEPAAVRVATAEYRAEQDIVATFIDENCVVSPEARVKANTLYAAYKAWAEAGGERPIGSKTFGSEIGKRYHRTTSNGTWYVGVGLAAD